MKKLIATICILGSAATLAACSADGRGNHDQAPYAQERTVGSQTTAPAQSEQVFHQKMTK